MCYTEEKRFRGHAAYSSAVKLQSKLKGDNTSVGATAFMTFHTVLKNSSDYTAALRFARELSDNLTRSLIFANQSDHNNSDVVDLQSDKIKNSSDWSASGQKIFAYSVFYVFYEQYLTVVTLAWVNLVASLSAIFFMSFVLLGFDLWSALVILWTICMILASMFGMMFFWSISLNAVSLVNLVMVRRVTTNISHQLLRHL